MTFERQGLKRNDHDEIKRQNPLASQNNLGQMITCKNKSIDYVS